MAKLETDHQHGLNAPMPKRDISGKPHIDVGKERENLDRDLGFGGKAAEARARLINRDGSFNIERRGLPFFQSFSLYHTLITMSWWRFNALVLLIYIVINLVFASIFMIVGMQHVQGVDGHTFSEQFVDAFFFSTQTFTTVGYGRMNPTGMMANSVAAVESLVGLLGFALATGMLYGRFSKPVAKILFSNVAVVAPYRGITGFMFRTANIRSNQLIDVEAEVNLSMLQPFDGKMVRRFYELELERKRVNFFHLSWTVVHPITETSPLFGMDEVALKKAEAEFTILFKGFDDAFSQTVHARSSYKPDEILFNTSFAKVISIAESGKALLDLAKFHDVEPVRLPVGVEEK